VLAALFAAAVILRVQVQTDREVHSITLVELPLVLGLFLVDPLGLVVARLVGSVPALLQALVQNQGSPLPWRQGTAVAAHLPADALRVLPAASAGAGAQ
jgi:hypothetical protein